jgi:hypothetical protein
MMGMMGEPPAPGDIQIMANTLQTQIVPGHYVETALNTGIAWSGWSWSAKFGDLDHNGFLDLYVVNGMIEETMFAHLPNHELVELNQAYANDGNGIWSAQLEWGLGSTASGRGLVLADFDLDGDLDAAVNNLRAPAQFMENQLCMGRSIQVDLTWEGVQNRHAIGAQLRLRTNQGTFTRDVRAASGYLSGDPARVHFGLPPGTVAGRLEIEWPDGARSSITDIAPGYHLQVARRTLK